jgi:NhaP-type Na+/H+ or K+/H+ antiporter
MLILHGAAAAVFIVLGILFLRGKCAFLIAGCSTSSKEKKTKTDEKKLCRYVGRLMLMLAGCFFVLMASDILEQLWLMWLCLGLFVACCLGGVIFLNTGGRLK